MSDSAAAAGWDISPLRSGEEDAFRRLFAAVFETAMSPQYFEWKYRQSPAGSVIVLGRDRDGRVLTNYSGVGVPLWMDGRGGRMVQITDSMSDPAARGMAGGRRGLFIRTAEAFYRLLEEDAETRFAYGFPAERHRRLGKLLLGYETGEPIGDLRRGLPAPPASWASRLRRAWYRVDLRSAPAAEYDDFWRRRRDAVAPCIDRTAAYLRWRYTDCPGLDCDFLHLRARSGRLLGLAVVASKGDEGAFLEYVPPDDHPYGARLLLTLVDERLAERGARTVTAWARPGSEEHALLLERGYASAQDETSAHQVIRLCEPGLGAASVLGRLRYSFGDCDWF